MELFDKKFVHFMWSDDLKGKMCFVSDDIGTLQEEVMKGTSTDIVHAHNTHTPTSFPFETIDDYYRFAYYDPNYATKKAYIEGKHIQYRFSGGSWRDISESDIADIKRMGLSWFDDDCEYRIKPESNRMTYRQLAEWLAKGNGQVRPYEKASLFTTLSCDADKNNKEVPSTVMLLRWDTDEWIEPTIDVYLNDCR